jgi:pimeloyl-ACP methyl ester carboxylesterase
MQKVYFIPGLGADKRAFSFLDVSFCNPVFINWIEPLHHERLEAYAMRLVEQIKEENATIVGLSFGGMLATEMAKRNPNFKVILLSSNKVYTEFPKFLRLGKYLPIYKWVPNKIITTSGVFFSKFLGSIGSEQKKIQLQIIKDTNPSFTKWAISAIMHWQNITIPKNLIHIHGTADKLLPYNLVKADYTIKGGEHLMVMDKAKEVSVILKSIIA